MTQQSMHSIFRSAQRNINVMEVEYILQYGKLLHRAGAIFYYLRYIDLPLDDRKVDRFNRLVGTAVVLSPDGRTLITVWRNRRYGLSKIKKKQRYGKSNPFQKYPI